jgi:UDP-galactopyranose mutase
LIIDKRPHIGGNCFDYIDDHGIRVSKYGAHIFHTKSDRVWNYVRQFSDWIPYAHRVKGYVQDVNGTFKVVPVPPNQV